MNRLTRSLQPTTAAPFVVGDCRKFATPGFRWGLVPRRLWLREVVRHQHDSQSSNRSSGESTGLCGNLGHRAVLGRVRLQFPVERRLWAFLMLWPSILLR